jgi:hypothetical protein
VLQKAHLLLEHDELVAGEHSGCERLHPLERLEREVALGVDDVAAPVEEMRIVLLQVQNLVVHVCAQSCEELVGIPETVRNCYTLQRSVGARTFSDEVSPDSVAGPGFALEGTSAAAVDLCSLGGMMLMTGMAGRAACVLTRSAKLA